MKLALRNKLFSFISLSRIFNTLGASIFNIVFVVFASSMPNPKFAIAVANFIVLVPTFFTIFVGIKADKTIHKARWLIHFGYVQALLFVLVAFMTRSSSYLAFSVVCFMNILSDIISDYRSGLQMPILKKNIPEQDLMEAFSFTQLISFLCSLAGQALGVWLLAISQQNFFLVALVNSLTFLLSSTTLYLVRRRLTHDPVTISENKPPLKEELKKMYTSSKLIFEQEGSNSFLKLLAQILVINAMGVTLDSSDDACPSHDHRESDSQRLLQPSITKSAHHLGRCYDDSACYQQLLTSARFRRYYFWIFSCLCFRQDQSQNQHPLAK